MMTMCIRAPRPGRYVLLLTHNRGREEQQVQFLDQRRRVSEQCGKLGRSRPKVSRRWTRLARGVTT
jgi:hypothetical protein